jgi:hypothetical protein
MQIAIENENVRIGMDIGKVGMILEAERFSRSKYLLTFGWLKNVQLFVGIWENGCQCDLNVTHNVTSEDVVLSV